MMFHPCSVAPALTHPKSFVVESVLEAYIRIIATRLEQVSLGHQGIRDITGCINMFTAHGHTMYSAAAGRVCQVRMFQAFHLYSKVIATRLQ